jgi:hypothetical protein
VARPGFKPAGIGGVEGRVADLAAEIGIAGRGTDRSLAQPFASWTRWGDRFKPAAFLRFMTAEAHHPVAEGGGRLAGSLAEGRVVDVVDDRAGVVEQVANRAVGTRATASRNAVSSATATVPANATEWTPADAVKVAEQVSRPVPNGVTVA